MGHGSVFVTEISPIITYAFPTFYSFTYIINSDEYRQLLNDPKPIEVSMAFGSDKSVTRRSDYSIKLADVSGLHLGNQPYSSLKDLNSLMNIEKNENISMNEVWQGSEEDRHLMNLNGI